MAINRSTRMLACALAAFAMTAANSAGAVRVDGMNPMQPVSALVFPAVASGTLRIDLPDNGVLSVTPWPGYLPQHFGQQHVSANRHLHPAGPIDRIEFRRPSAPEPWLIVMTGARSSQSVLGSWKLDFNNGEWAIRNSTGALYVLTNNAREAHAVRLKVKGERWCVYLLDVPKQHRQDGALAHEQEAQLSWAAVHHRAGKCPVPH